MTDNIKVLLVMPEEELSEVFAVPAAESLEVTTARSCDEARAALAGDCPVDVVVADLTFEDGNWWSVYQHLANRDVCAEMIVLAPRRGLDVSEILAHGVYAVLGRPLDATEVVRTIEEAAAHKVNGKGPRARQPAVAGV